MRHQRLSAVFQPERGPAASAGRTPSARAAAFARAVGIGLSDRPRWLPCRFLYDRRGSRLFERICQTPEYYLTRTEAAILEAAAGAVRDLTGPVTLVELGSGTARKTGHLLAAYAAAGQPVRYLPVDVSRSALQRAARAIGSRYPTVEVQAIHGRYEAIFPQLPAWSPVMVLFLGSTIGNLNQTEAQAFWSRMSRYLGPGDFVLLGVDLVKDPGVIEAAYNDAAGYSAAFTKNLFARMNRELGTEVDLDRLTHVARYHAEWRRVEIGARFESTQTIQVRPLGRSIRIEAGEQVMTEISRKFELADLAGYLECFGLALRHAFTDPQRWYAVLLLQRQPGRSRPVQPLAGSGGPGDLPAGAGRSPSSGKEDG